MKFITAILLGTLIISQAHAASLPKGQSLSKIEFLNSDHGFPQTKIEVVYIRACGQRLVDIVTRSQIAAGKNYLEVGALVEDTHRPCRMNEPAFIKERAVFRTQSDLPIVLLELDLTLNLRAPINPSGATIGNF